ncbi:hypothetical protein SAMN05216557_10615 [Sphingomonas carotinifaciens]|uniref:Uncharacterized protein n=1 Tax=Sphingomonas carotinifaciens TaxID=1166323 RepID=A0A1G7P0D1_9SPHN|nr:hypothetical protein [Sphingomonas carotinifaciens]SDF79768.1 hypothetical protein SAMN05216557_10615 [Sphingomonas carotinifaciens]
MKWYPIPKNAPVSIGDQPLDGTATLQEDAMARIWPDLHPGYSCIRIFWNLNRPIH